MVYSVYHCSCSWSQRLLLIVGGHSGNEFVFLTCGSWKTLELLEMLTNLAPGSQTFRYKWRALYALLFLFIVLVSIVASLKAKLFFHLWVRFEVEVLSYSIFTEKFAIGFQNWLDHEWIELECFCCSSPCWMSSHLHGLKSVICVSFQRYDVFLIFNLRGIKVYYSNVPYFLAIEFSNNDWWALSMQYNFTSIACASLSQLYLQVVMKRLSICFWKPFILFSDFFQSPLSFDGVLRLPR